jgi:hypothetical protein
MYGVFIYALSLNSSRHNPGAKMPCYNFWNRDIPSNARKSEVQPGFRMDMSSILPSPSITYSLIVQSELLLPPTKEFMWATPSIFAILQGWFMYPNKNPINCLSTTFKISSRHIFKALGYRLLFIVIFWV